ncbi:MAG: hypothetical protein IKU43_05240 [Clostridia bacterium]|nr:hypothetical protein [Clostridia bacterium]
MERSVTNDDIKEYYAAANTGYGFYSLFGEVFSPEKLRRIYILKGGPGCGKSTLMRKVSEKAVKLGYAVQNYFCSSSPTSLDGVIIPALSVAVLDGTAPHTVDARIPGVCESIVNLGEAWDIDAVEKIGEDIRFLVSEKSSAYKRAYAYLESCVSAEKIINECRNTYLLEKKLCKAVERICVKIRNGNSDGKINYVFTDCICGSGNLHLDTFEKMAETRYFIRDYGDIAPVFFDVLALELTVRGHDITVAKNPLNPDTYCGIYIDGCGISFTVHNDDFCRILDRKGLPYKIMNLARFCDSEKFKQNKIYYRYADKARKNLMQGAASELALAASLHEKIESLYYGITDYSVVENMTDKLIEKIFA